MDFAEYLFGENGVVNKTMKGIGGALEGVGNMTLTGLGNAFAVVQDRFMGGDNSPVELANNGPAIVAPTTKAMDPGYSSLSTMVGVLAEQISNGINSLQKPTEMLSNMVDKGPGTAYLAYESLPPVQAGLPVMGAARGAAPAMSNT